MSEQAPDRLWSGIQISKVVAGTLAAVAAAVLGSFLGVAGTLAGAALASVVGTVGTQLFDNSLKRGTKTLQAVAPTFIKVPAAVGTPPVAAATEEEKPSHTVPQEPGRFAIRWKPVLVGAATVFIVAMGAIFAVEAMAGRSLTSITTGHDTGGGTTLTSVVSDDKKQEKPTPAPSESPAPDESTAPDTSVTESPEPGSTTSSPEPTETTTAPAEPTTEPATEAPQQTDPAGTGEQQFNQQQQEQQQQDPTSE